MSKLQYVVLSLLVNHKKKIDKKSQILYVVIKLSYKENLMVFVKLTQLNMYS